MAKSGCDPNNKKVRKELPVLNTSGKADIAHSRTSRWRAFALILVNLLMVAHIIQWWLMGTTVSPIEPSEAMFTLRDGFVNAGFIFFSLAILATLIFGRFVCGWGCHVIALQDLCAWILKKMGLKPRPFRSRLLMYVPLIAALYMFVWPTVSRALTKPPSEPLIPQFTNHIITTDFWATFPPVAVAIPFLFICGFVTVYFLGSKGFCTYGCPYGGFFAVADKFAPGRIRVTDACNECGHCTATCTSNVKVHAEVKQYGMVVDAGCMKCMDCVSVCPNDALYWGFGKPSVAIEKKAAADHPLTWTDEIIVAASFVLSYFAVWNVYQLVPMLMAIGIAIVTAFVVYKTLRLASSPNNAFYHFALRSSGKFTAYGLIFLAFSAIWLGLNIHSGYVRYHEYRGNQAFESLTIPDELALAEADPRQWIESETAEIIRGGIANYSRAADAGLFTNVDALPKYAWLEYLNGEPDRALELLAKAAERQSGEAKAISLYYSGAIRNRLGRFQEAKADLNAALAERPDLILAREELGETLWQMGDREEAFKMWLDAVLGNQNLVISNNFLAGASAVMGKSDGSAYERRAEQATPRDALFNWVVGLRLRNVGMDELADKHFRRAALIDSSFRQRIEQLKQRPQ
ncbi:MAG: 4Fe-4S binding protein [Acidobacteria bacterium]|nr:4Fe-4S binding protein [Acidobacteriota bacterium]